MWGALSVSLVRDARGCPRYFVGQIEDITEKKLLEEKVHTMPITDELKRPVHIDGGSSSSHSSS